MVKGLSCRHETYVRFPAPTQKARRGGKQVLADSVLGRQRPEDSPDGPSLASHLGITNKRWVPESRLRKQGGQVLGSVPEVDLHIRVHARAHTPAHMCSHTCV